MNKTRFSKLETLIFILVFGLIGFLIWRSFAAVNPNLPGDLNNDNSVGVIDLSILLSNYNTTNPAGDVNGDGIVNVIDLSILLSHYGQISTGGNFVKFYVSPAGNDSNSGTSPATAWKTVSKANSVVLKPGETILFQGGQTFNGELIPSGSGTAGNPTAYGSYGNGKATITAGSVGISLGNQSDVLITNLIVDGRSSVDCIKSRVSGNGSVAITLDAVEVRNCAIGIHDEYIKDEGWVVKNSYIHDTSDSGMILWAEGSSRTNGKMLIEDNTFDNTGTNANLGYGSHGIYSKSPGVKVLRNNIGNFSSTLGNGVSSRYRNALIEGNSIHDGPHAIAYYNYDVNETPGQGTSTVRYNRFWNISGYGMILDNQKCALQPSGSACMAAGPENWRIYNNTFGPGSTRGCGIDNRAGTTSTELLIKNNIFIGSWSFGQLCMNRKPPNFAEDHNDFAATGDNAGNGAGDITAAPNLTAAPNFKPLAGSKTIDAGTVNINGANYSQACDGLVLHYCGLAPDMGAVEF